MTAGWKTVEQAAPEKLMDRSVNDLRRRYPDMSASRTLSRGQLLLLAAAGLFLTAGVLAVPLPMLIALNALGTAAYLVVFAHGLLWFREMVRRPALVLGWPQVW